MSLLGLAILSVVAFANAQKAVVQQGLGGLVRPDWTNITQGRRVLPRLETAP
jgi:hypothetical protein